MIQSPRGGRSLSRAELVVSCRDGSDSDKSGASCRVRREAGEEEPGKQMLATHRFLEFPLLPDVKQYTFTAVTSDNENNRMMYSCI
eukprot:762029-Hanusia_phi.AAC.4